jgi:hypothetical protein
MVSGGVADQPQYRRMCVLKHNLSGTVDKLRTFKAFSQPEALLSTEPLQTYVGP